MRHRLQNIFYLGVKELRSLRRDTMMLVLIVFAFSGQVYLTATVQIIAVIDDSVDDMASVAAFAIRGEDLIEEDFDLESGSVTVEDVQLESVEVTDSR